MRCGQDAARDRLAGVPAAAGSELLEQAAVIAKNLQENVFDIVSELSAMMAREIDQLDTDPKLVELLEASVHGNVSTIIHPGERHSDRTPATDHRRSGIRAASGATGRRRTRSCVPTISGRTA